MSLEFNKVAAAVLTAGVVAMFSSFIGRELFHTEHLETPAYQIASVGGADGGGTTTEEPAGPAVEPILALLAGADPTRGEGLFKPCAACHTVEKGGPNKIGPNLWGIVGRPHAAIDGFAYSQALTAMAGEPWSYEDISHFIAAPKSYAPGTKMTYPGMKKPQDRADLVAYLRTQSDEPAPLPSQEEIDALQKADAGSAPAEGQPADDQAAAGSTEGETAGGEAATGEAASEEPTAGETATGETGAGEATAGETAAGEAGTAAGGTQTAEAADGELVAAIGAADVAQGEKIFKTCTACHTIEKDGANKVGPNLWGIVGAPYAHRDDFNYSTVFKEAHAAGKVWTYADLDAYLTSPKEFLPGNKMTFVGLKKPEQRAAVIAFLRSKADAPAPLE